MGYQGANSETGHSRPVVCLCAIPGGMKEGGIGKDFIGLWRTAQLWQFFYSVRAVPFVALQRLTQYKKNRNLAPYKKLEKQ